MEITISNRLAALCLVLALIFTGDIWLNAFAEFMLADFSAVRPIGCVALSKEIRL